MSDSYIKLIGVSLSWPAITPSKIDFRSLPNGVSVSLKEMRGFLSRTNSKLCGHEQTWDVVAIPRRLLKTL